MIMPKAERIKITYSLSFIIICIVVVRAWSSLPAASSVDAAREKEPVSVQIHLHGSLSEGPGSMEWQVSQASAAGIDVLWWTDHDWRVLYLTHVDGFDFEEATYNATLDWFVAPIADVPGKIKWWGVHSNSLLGKAYLVMDDAYDGSKSLKLQGTSRSDSRWQELSYRFDSNRQRHKRALASDVSLGIAIKVEEPVGSDAEVFVNIALSEHPASRHELQYVISDFPDSMALSPETIPLTYTVGAWAFYELPVTADAERVYPNGDDNSLSQVSLGVRARNGATVRALFDTYEIHHDIALQGQGLLAEQVHILERYDQVTNLVGTEVSYHSPHLNAFCDGLPELLDYDAVDQSTYAETAVAQAHAQGCLVSYNHPAGTIGGPVQPPDEQETRSLELALELLDNAAWGADLLEVGYLARGGLDLEHHLRTWDRLTANGLFLCGNGTSDAHGREWAMRTNHLMSWVWSGGEDAPSLLSGLRDCRVYFGDIYLWDGDLDLVVEGTHMGGDVSVLKGEVNLEVILTPVPDGEVRLVQGIIQPGLDVEYVRNGEVINPGSQVISDTTRSSFVRIEVWRDQTPIVFSNPIRIIRLSAPYQIHLPVISNQFSTKATNGQEDIES
jgi:hypothetical protein